VLVVLFFFIKFTQLALATVQPAQLSKYQKMQVSLKVHSVSKKPSPFYFFE